jgi:hypothetical protein
VPFDVLDCAAARLSLESLRAAFNDVVGGGECVTGTYVMRNVYARSQQCDTIRM